LNTVGMAKKMQTTIIDIIVVSQSGQLSFYNRWVTSSQFG